MTAVPLPYKGNHIMLCRIQQVLPKQHPRPLHHRPNTSLPRRGYCSIKSPSNTKEDSCGVALWLFSTSFQHFPYWGLAPDPLVKFSDNIAIKDLILILKLIVESTGQEGSEQGGLQDTHRCCHNTVLDAVLAQLLWHPERLKKQEGCKKFVSWL